MKTSNGKISEEPAFRPETARNLKALYRAYLEGGKPALSRQYKALFSPGASKSPSASGESG